MLDDAVSALRAEGAVVADATFPGIVGLLNFGICAAREQTKANDANCSVVLKYGFKRDFNHFLASLGPTAPVPTLQPRRGHRRAPRLPQRDRAVRFRAERADATVSNRLRREGWAPRDHIHGHGVQQADVDSSGLCVRAGYEKTRAAGQRAAAASRSELAELAGINTVVRLT